MNQLFLILHSWLRWAILIAAVWTVVRALKGIGKKSAYTSADNKSNLFFMIFMDLQFLAGILLYFTDALGFKAVRSMGMSNVMQNESTRFFAVEHVVMMILAWIIVHIGRSVVKKAPTDIQKHRKSLVYFGIALLLILLAIPWPFRTGLGFHPWFRF